MRRFQTFLFFLGVALVAGCGTSGGCSGQPVEPIPGGYTGAKSNNAAVLRISKAGFDYLNANWKPLVANVVPGTKTSPANSSWLEIPFPMPCTDIGDPGFGVGNVFVCDNGKGVGTAGYMDAACTASSSSSLYDAPCPVLMTVRKVTLAPASPDRIDAQAVLTVDALKDITTRATSKIAIDSKEKSSACAWMKRLGCQADFHSSGGTRADETFSAKLQFKLDPNWNQLLSFQMVPPNPSEPDELIGGLTDLESADLVVDGIDRCTNTGCTTTEDMCNWICDAANLGFIKGLIVDYAIKPQLSKAVTAGMAKQRCRPCNPSDPLAYKCPSGSTCGCFETTGCKDAEKVCVADSAHGGGCVPRPLGFEGRVAMGQMLSTVGAATASKMDVLAAAGGAAPVINTGFQASAMGGVKALAQSACVPVLTPPAESTLPAPALDTEGPAGYHAGIAVSKYFLNNVFFQAHQAGAMCLNINTTAVPAFSTGILKMALPSLGVLAGTATTEAPAMAVLRPLGAPIIHIGEGTYDPTTKKPIKPLITIELTDLRIDVYAFIEDRYVRLFTLAADVKVPVSIIAEGCPTTILPALGDLKQMLVIRSDVESNAEILAEDPKALAQLIPMILGMAQPMIADSFKPIAIPDMNGFRVNVKAIKGVGRIGTSEAFNYMGAFATLGLAGTCPSPLPPPKARLARASIPPRDEMRLRADRPLPWPKATVEVPADRGMEFSWRVDGGLWSTWFDGPFLEIEHPTLIAPGRHLIEVRSRLAEDPDQMSGAGEPVVFSTDWEPPRVKLVVDREAGEVRAVAADDVTSVESLQFAWRLGSQAPSRFGPHRPLDLREVEQAGSVTVEVMDEAGLVATASWAPSGRPVVTRAAVGPTSDAASGCSSAGAGLALAALAAVPLALGLRRKRAR